MKTLSIVVILIFFLLIPHIQPILAELLIVEVQIYGEKANNDFIKIYNTADNVVDISGYKLRKRTSTGSESSVRVFPNGSTISENGYFLWANSQNDFHLSVGADIWSRATLAKNNSIALLTPDDVIIDVLAWGESQNPFVKGSPFPENPEAKQQLKRKLVNGIYQNTSNNSRDFYLYPAPEPPQSSQSQNESEQQSVPQAQQELEPVPQLKTSQTAEELSKSQQQLAPQAAEPGTTAATRVSLHQRIDINTAPAPELQKLAGIGSLLAQRIIDARPFYSVDELTKVRGIGTKTLQDIKSQGLAWVDPALKPPQIERETESTERGVAAVAKPFSPFDSNQDKKAPKRFSVFLIALVLALFCGAIIFILKKKLKTISEKDMKQV